MYLSDEAVVLQHTPYQSSSAVITCFTESQGKLAFMVRGFGSGKSKNHRRIHAGAILELEYLYSEKREVQTVRSLRRSHVYTDVPENVMKSSLIFFIAEIVLKSTVSRDSNADAFSLLKHTLQWIDGTQQLGVIHLYFLMQWLKLSGVVPPNSPYKEGFFDCEQGNWLSRWESRPYVLSLEQSNKLLSLLGMNFDDLQENVWTRKEKQDLLRGIVRYLCAQLSINQRIHSLDVLESVFDEV